MPAGLRLFNELGQEIVSYTDRLTRIVGTRTIGDAGNVSVGDLKGGALWYAFLPNAAPDLSSQAGFTVGYQPVFTVNGSNLSWVYNTPTAGIAKATGTLIYGIY